MGRGFLVWKFGFERIVFHAGGVIHLGATNKLIFDLAAHLKVKI